MVAEPRASLETQPETAADPSTSGATAPLPTAGGAVGGLSRDEFAAWLMDYMAYRLNLGPIDFDPATPFDELGIDSVEAVVLASAVEEELDINIEPVWLFEYPSVDLFVAALPGLLDGTVKSRFGPDGDAA